MEHRKKQFHPLLFDDRYQSKYALQKKKNYQNIDASKENVVGEDGITDFIFMTEYIGIKSRRFFFVHS